MNRFLVTIHVRGVGDYEVEVPSRTAEAAGRRAIMTLWSSYHSNLTLDDFKHTNTVDLGSVHVPAPAQS